MTVICTANKLTTFYTIGTSDMKKLNKDSAEMTELLNGLCESVKAQFFDLLSVFNLYFFALLFPYLYIPSYTICLSQLDLGLLFS